jgi:hypothetical protein
LSQRAFPDQVTTFEEISIHVACECLSFDFRSALNVWRNKNPDLDGFETVDSDETGIIVWGAETIFEKRRARAWKSKENIRRDWRADMLLLRYQGNVSVANFQRPGQEIPAVSDLRSGT